MVLKDTVMKLETLVSSMVVVIAMIHHAFQMIGITMLQLFLSEQILEKVQIEVISDLKKNGQIWFQTSQLLVKRKEHQLLWLFQLQVWQFFHGPAKLMLKLLISMLESKCLRQFLALSKELLTQVVNFLSLFQILTTSNKWADFNTLVLLIIEQVSI